jgi:hypothetical protein
MKKSKQTSQAAQILIIPVLIGVLLLAYGLSLIWKPLGIIFIAWWVLRVLSGAYKKFEEEQDNE